MNLDRAIAIKKPFYSSQQSNKTIATKILMCCLPAFVPGIPYLFNETLKKCKIKNPEQLCWPPKDSVIIQYDSINTINCCIFSNS